MMLLQKHRLQSPWLYGKNVVAHAANSAEMQYAD
jgi:hypothetical protein